MVTYSRSSWIWRKVELPEDRVKPLLSGVSAAGGDGDGIRHRVSGVLGGGVVNAGVQPMTEAPGETEASRVAVIIT